MHVYIYRTGTMLSNHVARGYIALRRFNLKGLLWCFVTDKDPLEVEMSHCNIPPSYVIAQQCPHLV